MALQVGLDRIRTDFERTAPAEALAIMHRVTDDLRASGMLEAAIDEGQEAPEFTLGDSHGHSTSLGALRAKGPVVLTFFRGDW